MKYQIRYYFDGQGICEIEAKTPKDAEEKWRNGEFDEQNEDEWGTEYNLDEVVKL